MRALDLSNLLIAVMARHRDDDPGASASELRQLRDDVRERLERYRKMLAGESPAKYRPRRAASGRGRRRRRRRRPPSCASCAPPCDRSPASWPAVSASRRRRHRRGRLDVRRTLRRSLDAGGTPLDPAFRRARPTKPRLVVLCDISGSVAEFAHFTLMLLHALRAELAGLRAFVFVDGVAEVTSVLERGGGLPRPTAARHAAWRRRRRRPQRLRAGVGHVRRAPRRRPRPRIHRARRRRRPHELPRLGRREPPRRSAIAAGACTGSTRSPPTSGATTTPSWTPTESSATACSRCAAWPSSPTPSPPSSDHTSRVPT